MFIVHVLKADKMLTSRNQMLLLTCTESARTTHHATFLECETPAAIGCGTSDFVLFKSAGALTVAAGVKVPKIAGERVPR